MKLHTLLALLTSSILVAAKGEACGDSVACGTVCQQGRYYPADIGGKIQFACALGKTATINGYTCQAFTFHAKTPSTVDSTKNPCDEAGGKLCSGICVLQASQQNAFTNACRKLKGYSSHKANRKVTEAQANECSKA
jgi:hypothetical protein